MTISSTPDTPRWVFRKEDRSSGSTNVVGLLVGAVEVVVDVVVVASSDDGVGCSVSHVRIRA
jgi:hypothetical protein